MTISARSVLMAGLATVTASAVLIAPSVQPLPAPKPAIQLAAAVQPTAQPADYFSQLAEWWQPIFWPSAGQPVPPPPNEPFPTPQSIASGFENGYHAIEPWVQYGFEVATYAVGWIPYVGWLSGQIMIFYNFGERIVHAIAHNTLDWLDGDGSFLQNLGEGIRWSIDALIQLGIDEWNYFLPPLPPLPPIPCIVFCGSLSEFNAPLDGIRVGLRDTVTGSVAAVVRNHPGHARSRRARRWADRRLRTRLRYKENRPGGRSQPRASDDHPLLEPRCCGTGRGCGHSFGCAASTEKASATSHIASRTAGQRPRRRDSRTEPCQRRGGRCHRRRCAVNSRPRPRPSPRRRRQHRDDGHKEGG